MTDDTNTTDGNDENQLDSTLSLVGAPKHTYNWKQIEDFTESVFGQNVARDAHRLVYASNTNVPSFPIDMLRLGNKISRSSKAKVLYYNTSSCFKNEDGELRSQKSLFSALHVVVLDDIGTKIPADKIPEGMTPSYIIESSEGNFQYGYVLETPITNYDEAKALIETIALAGLTDQGGAMPVKLVRLPDGINGKKDPDKHGFQVKLIDNNGPMYKPEFLLEKINHEIDGHQVTWQSIKDGSSPLKKATRVKHMKSQPQNISTEGIIDEVMEVLGDEDLIVEDTGEDWVTVSCPWGHGHTTGEDTAGYSPLGRGDNPFMRGFHCFHEHCKDKSARDFLQWVMSNSELVSIPIYDPSTLRVGEYAFDMSAEKVWAVGKGDKMYSMGGFNGGFNDVVFTHDKGKPKARKTTAAKLWMDSPYRIIVDGSVHEPNGDAIIEIKGRKYVNTYKPPEWGTGTYDIAHVDRFRDYLEYLLPDPAERAYFLDWLSSKAQDPTFRGTGIVMVAENQGMGRSTLADMITTLFDKENCADVSFDALINPSTFNFWEDKLFVTVAEAMDTGQGLATSAIKAYETLKQRVDTSNSWTTINLKGKPQRPVKACSSFLILTNHLNGLGMAINDRRLTVLTNALTPKPQQYFTDLHVWLDDDEWARSVYRWLHQRTVTNNMMLPLPTATKVDMTNSTQSPLVRVCHLVADKLTAEGIHAITNSQMKEILDKVLLTRGDEHDYSDRYKVNSFNDVSIAFKHFRVKVDGLAQRIRVLKASAPTMSGMTADAKHKKAADLDDVLKQGIITSIAKVDVPEIVAHVVDEMDS